MYRRNIKTPNSDSRNEKPVSIKIKGRILKGVGGNYQVLTEDGQEVTAKPRGILRKEKVTPYPGDFVDLSSTEDETVQYNIDNVHPRHSFLIRPAIANLDLIIITCSACSPDPDYLFMDKLIILCKKAGVETSLCITKADLNIKGANVVLHKYKCAGIPIFILGKTDEYDKNFDDFRKYITGKTVSFAGQSGVGKSTLLNRIIKRDGMEVGEISRKFGKGKQTTRHSQIFVYKSGFLADTPGFCTLELEDLGVTGSDVLNGFPEIAQCEGKCRFIGCRHIGEAGCAINDDAIDADRLARYRQFRKQMDAIQPYEREKKKDDTRNKDGLPCNKEQKEAMRK